MMTQHVTEQMMLLSLIIIAVLQLVQIRLFATIQLIYLLLSHVQVLLESGLQLQSRTSNLFLLI